MKRNLEDYIKVYNLIPSEVCKETINQLQTANWEKHEYFTVNNYDGYSFDDDLSICNDIIPNSEILMQLSWESFRTYITDFNFEWYDGWAGHSSVRYNRYSSDTQMRLHCDHIHTIFDGQRKGIPTMTSLGILNDDYEGGEFIIFDDMKLNLKAGDIVVFPSNFLYPHKVNPVLSGVRYSFVSWAW